VPAPIVCVCVSVMLILHLADIQTTAEKVYDSVQLLQVTGVNTCTY
jgi:hypothetical protein